VAAPLPADGRRTHSGAGRPDDERRGNGASRTCRPIADTPLSRRRSRTVSPDELHASWFPAWPGPVLVFVNGRTRRVSAPGSVLPASRFPRFADAIEHAPVSLESWLARDQDYTGHPFAALNTALFDDGALRHLATTPSPATPSNWCSCRRPRPGRRIFGAAGARAARQKQQARMIETFESAGPASGFTTPSPRLSWVTAPCWNTAACSASPSRRPYRPHGVPLAIRAVPCRTRSPWAAGSPGTTRWPCRRRGRGVHVERLLSRRRQQ